MFVKAHVKLPLNPTNHVAVLPAFVKLRMIKLSDVCLCVLGWKQWLLITVLILVIIVIVTLLFVV